MCANICGKLLCARVFLGGGGKPKNHVGPQGGEGVLEAGPRGQIFDLANRICEV